MIGGQIIRFRNRVFKVRNRSFQDPKIMVYLIGFLYAFHITPAIYINSSFLNQFTGSNKVGYVYSAASLLTIMAIVVTRRFLQVFGNYITFKTTMYTNIACFAFLSLHLIVKTNPFWVIGFIVAFIVSQISISIGFLSIDIFLEHYSDDSDTGLIRGIFLTGSNIAFFVGPLIASVMVTGDFDSANVYIWGMAFALLTLLLAKRYFKKFPDRKYERSHIFESFLEIRKNPNLFNIFMCNLVLNIFYAIVVIYIPIFLYTQVGFSLSQVGTLIGISLIPFVLFQIPMGRIADQILGEKEMLTAGLIITAFSTFTVTLFSEPNYWLWAVILFSTRIGASAIEIMTESYLFKQIHSGNINILGLFRVIRPTAYIITPLVASLLLLKFNMTFLFLVTACLLIYAIRYSLVIVDTR